MAADLDLDKLEGFARMCADIGTHIKFDDAKDVLALIALARLGREREWRPIEDEPPPRQERLAWGGDAAMTDHPIIAEALAAFWKARARAVVQYWAQNYGGSQIVADREADLAGICAGLRVAWSIGVSKGMNLAPVLMDAEDTYPEIFKAMQAQARKEVLGE